MTIQTNDNELQMQFKTKNFMLLKQKLRAENLRQHLAKAAYNSDFDVLAKTIVTFTDCKEQAAYDAIDAQQDKQAFFYDVIVAIGENGFFERTTTEQLKQQAQFDIDAQLQTAIDKLAPDIIKQALENNIMTGATTLTT